jgi:hypothetical protein
MTSSNVPTGCAEKKVYAKGSSSLPSSCHLVICSALSTQYCLFSPRLHHITPVPYT